MAPDSRTWLALILSFVPSLAPLAAQTASDRAALDAFRDTLGGIDSPDRVPTASAGDGEPRLVRIRQALIQLRQGELGDDRVPYDAAIRTIERTIDAEPQWPYPWYVLGLIQLGMYRRAFLVKSSNYLEAGLSYREAALRSFGRSIAADSSFMPAVTAWAGLVMSLGHRLLPHAARGPVDQIRNLPGRPSEASLAISRLDFVDRAYTAALVDLDEYLRLGGDSAVGRLEQARTLMALGRGEAAVAAYQEGLAHFTDIGLLAYREDIAWVAGPGELDGLDSLSLAAAGPWIGRFWQERDALELRSPNERLAEHLRRWVYSHEHYLLHRPDDVPANAEGFGPQDQTSLFEVGAVGLVMEEVTSGIPVFRNYRRTQWELDDRGVLYLRFGEPARRVSSVAGPPNESWAYDLPEGRRVFHFLGSRALGTQAATTLAASLPLDADMLDARADLDARYGILAARIRNLYAAAKSQAWLLGPAGLLGGHPNTPQEVAAFERAHPKEYSVIAMPRFGADALWRETSRNRRAISAAVISDGYAQHFKESLGAIVQAYGLGLGAGQAKRALVVFAVPGRRLAPTPRSDGRPGVLYPLSFRLIAIDRGQGEIARLDTTRTFAAPDTLRGDQYLTGHLELPIAEGRYQVRVLINQPGGDAGTGFGADSVSVPGEPTTLMISDLILGRAGSGLTWTYAGDRVSLNPLDAFPKGSDAELFYEVAGLEPGRLYSVTTSVRKAGDKPASRPLVEVSFNLDVATAYARIHRGIGLAGLRPGAYVLRLRVEEVGSGRVVERDRALNILDR